MFGFMRTSPIGGSVNYRDYTFEGDGHLYAFQEAFHDLSEVDGMFATMNCQGVNAYAKGYHNGGLTVARESADAFMKNVVMEGFFGDVKDRLIKLLKTLKEKIKAFFHSAVQYFDAFFKDGAAFAEKYEDELNKKDLSGFKYQMYTYKQLNGKLGDCSNAWKRMKEIAMSKAKSENVDLTVRESFGFYDDWIGSLIILTETVYWRNKHTGKVFATPNDGNRGSAFVKISSSEYATAVANGKHMSSTRNGPDDDGSNDDEDEKTTRAEVPRNNEEDDDDELDDARIDALSKKEESSTTVNRITNAQRKAIRKFCDWEIGKLSKMGEGDFDKQARKSFRDGQNTPRDIEPDIGDIIETLKNSKEQLSDLKDIQDAFMSDFDDEFDIVKGMDKSGDNGIRVSNHVAVFTIAKDSFMRYFNILKDVMIERNKTYKSCLSAALHYKAEK